MEITSVLAQEVAVNSNVLFTETPVHGSSCISHREGSGVVTLRGITNQARARFLVDFSGNIAVPTTATVGEISLAIAIEGEALEATRMRQTPSGVNRFYNVSAATYIDVPRGCCAHVSVINTSPTPVTVANANLIVTREA